MRTILTGGLLVLSVARAHAVDVTCPSNQQKEAPDPGQCGAVVTYPDPVVTGGISTGCLPPSGSFFAVGSTPVTCGAFDPGPPDFDTCTFEVRVPDTQPPSITCPANVEASTDPGQCGATVAFPAATFSDNCPGVALSASRPSPSFFGVTPEQITQTATDGAGNTATCSFAVAARDAEAPSPTCPASLETTLPPGQCRTPATYPELTAVDNCDGSFVFTISPPAGTLLFRGDAVARATAEDASGNGSACDIAVHVRFPNGVDCDGDRCTDEGCGEAGECTFVERAPTSPDGVLCNVDNLRDALSAAPAPECRGKCLGRLEHRLTKISDGIQDAQVGSPKKCRRRLAAMVRGAKKLSRVVERLAGAGKLDPTPRAQQATSQAAALLARGGIFAASYCPGG